MMRFFDARLSFNAFDQQAFTHKNWILNDATLQHLKVRRARVGETIVLWNGEGVEFHTKIVNMDKKSASVDILEANHISRESSQKIILIQSLINNDRMDFLIQKAVELGVATIFTAHTQHAAPLPQDRITKRLEHWQAVAIAACEQCGRNHLPQIIAPQNWQNIVQNLSDTDIFMLDPQAPTTLAAQTKHNHTLAFLIGPEGGFSQEECQQAAQLGVKSAHFGQRILRAETAAITAIAAAQTLWGDFAADNK